MEQEATEELVCVQAQPMSTRRRSTRTGPFSLVTREGDARTRSSRLAAQYTQTEGLNAAGYRERYCTVWGAGTPVESNQRGILKQFRAVSSSPHPSKCPSQFFPTPHSCPSLMPLERVRQKANPSLCFAIYVG